MEPWSVSAKKGMVNGMLRQSFSAKVKEAYKDSLFENKTIDNE